MQDITEKLCTNTAEGFEKQLKDTRDGQLYWVGKMKDGKCWMLQNLALGSTSEATTLTADDSDVSSNWNLPKSKTAPSGDMTGTAIHSWNFGKWVLATPELTTSCGNSTSGQAISRCTRVGFVDVSDTTSFQPTYKATTGAWDGANANSSTLLAVNCTAWSGSGTSKKCTAGTYDAHYLIGNYYTWNAAVANGKGSVCPKGWDLPIIPAPGYFIAIGAATFGDLLEAYGVNSKVSSTVNNVTYNIAGSPLRFVRSGAVNTSVGYVTNPGQNGIYWSSVDDTTESTYAYRLRFNASSVTTESTGRWYGSSVRCATNLTFSSTIRPLS